MTLTAFFSTRMELTKLEDHTTKKDTTLVPLIMRIMMKLRSMEKKLTMVISFKIMNN